MKRLAEILNLQRKEIELYRKAAAAFVEREVKIIPEVLGVLLTGSVARGDARKGPLGLMINLTIVLDSHTTLDLNNRFGPSVEPPDFPFHAIYRENEHFSIEAIELEKLVNIKNQPESVAFAS